MGTSTNEHGIFEIKVPEGAYTCSFQHLSYESASKTIQLPNDTEIHVTLSDKVYDLPMANIGAKKEDPAYDMMRKAIGMAPFYMNQLSKYNADVYIKGTLKIEKISGLVKAMAGKDLKKAKINEGEKYLYESMSEINFEQGKYHQTIKSISNTFPNSIDLELGMMNYNIYNSDNKGNLVSPLSPQAFSYYNFKYEGFSVESKHIINRIKISPKHKSAMTFEGYIYLSDGYWNVHRFELSNDIMGFEVTNRQTYGELDDNVWMPISNNVDVNVSMVGNKASITYVSSIKYNSFTVSPGSKGKFNTQAIELPDSSGSVSDTVDKSISQKSQNLAKQIETIFNKRHLNNRDAYKISQLMRKKEKEDSKLLPDSLKNKNPLDLSDRYKFEIDSTANDYTSDYWNENRPVPLMTDEIESYRVRDSLKSKENQPDSLKQKNSFGNILLGLTSWKSYKINSSLSFVHEGLIDPNSFKYNLVDGFVYKQSVSLRKIFKDTTNMRIGLSGEYAFSRKRFMFNTEISYIYLPEKQGSILINGGVKSSDFNQSSGLPNLDNEVSTLFFRKNFINFYESRYLNIYNSFEIINGLRSNIGFTYSHRKQLENTSDYSFFYKNSRNFAPNIPVQNPYVNANNLLVANHKAALLRINFRYTPQQYYTKNGRTKISRGSKYPTFSLTYCKGIKGIFDSQSDFDQFEFSVNQHFNFGAMTSFRYNFTTGWFPNNNNIHFSDFKHFNIKEFDLLFSPFNNSYNMIQTYMPSTNEWYATASVQYTSPYLLLKHLPLLNTSLIHENLYLMYLTSPYLKNYTEVGYSLSNIWMLGSVGAFVGFEKFEYNNWGFKFVINLSGF